MATILEFCRPERAESSEKKAVSADCNTGSAEIVIFPGVRIERRAAAPIETPFASTASHQGRGKAQRD